MRIENAADAVEQSIVENPKPINFMEDFEEGYLFAVL